MPREFGHVYPVRRFGVYYANSSGYDSTKTLKRKNKTINCKLTAEFPEDISGFPEIPEKW